MVQIYGSIILLGSVLLLNGCGKAPESPSVDSGEFSSYVSGFEKASQDHGKPVQISSLKIQYGELGNSSERAVCEIRESNPVPTITVSKEKWDRLSKDEREELMFHELGHCVLHRKHRNDKQ